MPKLSLRDIHSFQDDSQPKVEKIRRKKPKKEENNRIKKSSKEK